MKFNKKELKILFKAIKVMQSGEELLGIDIDKKTVNTLAEKFLKEIDAYSAKKINKEILSLIRESKELNQPEHEFDEPEFDREFGPNYAYSETLKKINQAIKKGQIVEIDYYSANQGKFTKRKVKPENIERRNGTPYLNAFCYLRNDDRVFKLGRIKDIKTVEVIKK